MSYLDELKQTTNRNSVTENGALTNDSTLNPVLDLFSMGAAMRGRKADAVKLFKRAYAFDQKLAIRCLFYIRDIRGGQGERDIFRDCVASLPEETQKAIAKYVPEYGRYDDWLSFGDSVKQTTIAEMIKEQLKADESNMKASKSVSLLAKWLPSENTSSKETRKQAKLIREAIGMNPGEYRRTLSTLRAYIKVLERHMSAKEWDKVDYESLPSQAHRKHVDAFKRHDEARYAEYVEAVQKGEKKIKTSTLFTYEVFDMVKEGKNDVADVMWANLPDYTNGKNALVLADVSGSMSGRPMSISVSLALYFAEHNKGIFKNHFLTFTTNSKLVQVLGKTLTEKLDNIENEDWDGSTNIMSAFKAILDAAVRGKSTQEEMPSTLYVISDMEFDSATDENDQTNFEAAKKMFEEAGYELPHVVFWQVDSRNDQSPATMYDSRVTLISGSSQSSFRYAVEGKTPLESMNDILNSERYSKITI
jgi:uncharacterized protein with von Willebrand factor type A (vWA) domain